MDQTNLKLSEKFVNPSYVRLGENSINRRDKMMKDILAQRNLPQDPLDQLTQRYFADSIALMDSNNFHHKVGVGEREARIFSRLVEERHFYLGHGIGRSGDLTANQPKAAGSSLLLQISRFLTVSALHELNYLFVKDVLLLPLATGMSLSLSLLALAEQTPHKKYVIWSRIDQKTCLKAIITANLEPIVVQLRQIDDFLSTDSEAIQEKIRELGSENILCVLSTTSCFAPRVPDSVQIISQIALKHKIYHVINNAYGVWCSKIAHSIGEAYKKGECTIVVQSTDKNFMVPVGGSIIFCQNEQILVKISAKYPGRASISPVLDMFFTLLSMGKSTLRSLQEQRKQNYKLMQKLANKFAAKHDLKVLVTPKNTISIGMSLKSMQAANITKLGSILYSKRVMGHRIVNKNQQKIKIGKSEFQNYGSHTSNYPDLPYITFACAVGTKREEIEMFFQRLQESVKELHKHNGKKQDVASSITEQTKNDD